MSLLYDMVLMTNRRTWYGIGILYDRYGSLDHAEEAFASVLRMDKGWQPRHFGHKYYSLYLNSQDLHFDKENEILFRLGIIYKQQDKYDKSLRCFDRILQNPPSPLAHADIWFQIGHVYEQQKDVCVGYFRTIFAFINLLYAARAGQRCLRTCRQR